MRCGVAFQGKGWVGGPIIDDWRSLWLCRTMRFSMMRNDPYSMYDTQASGNWYKADEPWGAFLQGDGNPAKTVHPYESDPSSGTAPPLPDPSPEICLFQGCRFANYGIAGTHSEDWSGSILCADRGRQL